MVSVREDLDIKVWCLAWDRVVAQVEAKLVKEINYAVWVLVDGQVFVVTSRLRNTD